MLLNSRALLTPGMRMLLAETVSAFAELETHMRLRATFWAFFLPRLANGLLCLRFGGTCHTESDKPRFIRLLDGALGVNPAQ
jgi:hypothetical protein